MLFSVQYKRTTSIDAWQNCIFLPQLGMHQRVVVQYECLQVNQASHLRRQAVQLVVAQVQVQQVRQVDEQLVGDGVDAVVAQIQHQHVPAVLQVPWDLWQLIVAQVLKGDEGGRVQENRICFLSQILYTPTNCAFWDKQVS